MKDYSIIVPVYCNAGTIENLVNQIYSKVLKKNKDLDGEIVFCDDGSYDDSFEILIKIKKNFEDIKIIKLTRNYGQIPALYSGLENIISKTYIVISADLQDPVELINEFLKFHFDEKFEIVAAERTSREDSLLERLSAKVFYKLLAKLCFPNFPSGGFDYFLISKKVRDIIIKTQQSNPYLQGEIFSTGYDIKLISYKRKKRLIGDSKWNFTKKLTYFMDGVLGYSFFPLRFVLFLGFTLFIASFVFAIFIFTMKTLEIGTFPLGWTTSIILMLLLNGIQLMFLGILGEYLWRTLSQTKNKSKYIVENIYD